MKGAKRLLAAALLLCILIVSDLPAAEVQASSTASQLDQIKKEKEKTKENKEKAEGNIDGLREETTGLQLYLGQLNSDLTDAANELNNLEQLIGEKTKEISDTKNQLEEAKRKEVKQAENMRIRIKFMYERSSNAYLEILLSANSFASFLNISEYVEKLAEYDNNLLKSYQELKETIANKEKQLKEEQDSLEGLLAQAQAKKDKVSALVQETHENVEDYKAQISEEEKNLIAYEQALAEQENSEAVLQKKLEEERALAALAAQMTMRNLSDINFNAGDADMMAAIIECEAGGESYTGKVAVGAVVMNRVKSAVFPDTIPGVIYQSRQFSPVGSGRFAIVLARGANQSCYQAANEAMAGASPVGNCLFFRTPIPGLTGIQIGGHIFY